MLMPWFSRGTLEDRYELLTATERTIVAYGIARGMKHLHAKFSIIHRDLKPANVFLDDHHRPLIADLGFAKVETDCQNSCRTGTGIWIAPECRLESERGILYGLKIDVFAYGMIVFQLHANNQPKLPAQKNTFIPGPRRLHPKFPSSIKQPDREWIDQLWAMAPSNRPSFARICALMEQGLHWFEGTDAEAFESYRKWVDEGEAKEAAKRVLAKTLERPAWMTLLTKEPDGEITTTLVSAVVTAANDGDLEAQKFAAMLFLSGVGVEQSTLKAVRYADECRDHLVATLTKPSIRATAWELGQIFEGLSQVRQAAEQYEVASQEGNVKALWRWGSLLLNNDMGCHIREGMALLEHAASLDCADACFELGRIYMSGQFGILDEKRGGGFLEKAAQLGHADAFLETAVFDHERLDFALAHQNYSRACDLGNETANQIGSALVDHGWVPHE
jgi:TPR repeat protein